MNIVIFNKEGILSFQKICSMSESDQPATIQLWKSCTITAGVHCALRPHGKTAKRGLFAVSLAFHQELSPRQQSVQNIFNNAPTSLVEQSDAVDMRTTWLSVSPF